MWVPKRIGNSASARMVQRADDLVLLRQRLSIDERRGSSHPPTATAWSAGITRERLAGNPRKPFDVAQSVGQRVEVENHVCGELRSGGGEQQAQANVDEIDIREAEHQLAVEDDSLVEQAVDEIEQAPIRRFEQAGERALIDRDRRPRRDPDAAKLYGGHGPVSVT